jgi:hypothetical protein
VGLVVLFGGVGTLGAQPSDRVSEDARIPFQDGSMFLSGMNVAWASFANDIGPDPDTPDLETFSTIFQKVGNNGGNAMRLWLHTNGWKTPEWGPDSTVVGPGEDTIKDLTALLDAAEEHDVGLVLCLWSFDMLRKEFGDEDNIGLNLDRNEALLRDSTHTQTYVDSALVPMVEAVGDHPAVVAWEIFNEPEGMAEEFGWDFNRQVPMSDIQRFVNQTAAGIRRADPDALVTNGAWSFISTTDQPQKARPKRPTADELSDERVEQIRRDLSERYRHPFTREEAREAYARLAKAQDHFNYYRDNRLIEEGGDPMGVLDFYSVHYYDWAGTGRSPFHADADYWELEKPISVMEFHMEDKSGVEFDELYFELFNRGYAGANGWSWTDVNDQAWNATLDHMASFREEHPGAVLPDSTEPDESSVTPEDFALRPPSPNPVRDRTTIVYDLSRNASVRLEVFDAIGRRVTTLVNERQDVDRYRVTFDASGLSSGIYFCRLRAGSFTETRRMAVVR